MCGGNCLEKSCFDSFRVVRRGLRCQQHDTAFFDDYGYMNSDLGTGKIGKFGSQFLGIESNDEVCAVQADEHLSHRIFNSDFPLQDGDDVNYKDVSIGNSDASELQMAIDDMVKRSLHLLPKRLHQTLRDIVTALPEVFRIRLGKDPPGDIPPMKIEFDGE